MKRMLLVTCAAAVVLGLTAAPAAADRSQARNYEAIPVVCEGLGEIVIEVVSLGQWGTGKVQHTNLTLIPRHFAFTVIDLDTSEVVFADEFAKRNPTIDDVCTGEFVEEVPEGDPFLPAGTYLIQFEVGVRVVGPPR